MCVLQDNRKVSSVLIEYEPSCVSINKEFPDVAVGGSTDNKVMKS